jgi:integrase
MGKETRIAVRVQRFADRPALQLQWADPASGRTRTRSARTADEAEAEQARSDLEYELNHGLHREGSRTSWDTFRAAFEAEYLPGVREDTRLLYANVFNHFERVCRPGGMDSITARTLSQFVAGLRQTPGKGGSMTKPSTIFSRLSSLKAAFRWACAQGMMTVLPGFPEVKVPRKKPQPVAPDLYERLLAATNDPFLRTFVASAWLIGLRRGEAQRLCWDCSGDEPWLDFPRQRIWLPAGFVKAVEDQWVPLPPELGRMLLELPVPSVNLTVKRRSNDGRNDKNPVKSAEKPSVADGQTTVDRRSGFVFPWHGLTRSAATQKVVTLARRAGVPLTLRTLRRGFGCRYAGQVPAQTLQRLMRHASINTTLAYYANLDAAAEEAILGKKSETNGDGKPSKQM